ncbi:hypothetical protein [Pedobacter frigoris]|uniref:Uncharacterized protein n=1 Tax=Pedobacter frigoris TaxID=2571272 RepID=A0A4U1CF00_9SPHI|nr:hypothetical protein [Pedobacter frigoris]TKC04897.1 hypothetical protein FA047_14085 [Pedobacter frigoris]
MQIMHIAFCIAVFNFALVAFFLVKDSIHLNLRLEQPTPLFPIFPIIAVLAVFIGSFLFKKQLNGVTDIPSADDKIAKYQTAFLIRSAILEGAALMNTVAFLMTSNSVFLLAAAFPFLFLLISRPAKQQIIDELNLTYPDTEKL